MKISQLKRGQRAKVLGFVANNKHYRQKLLAMGLTPGTEFVLSRIAPLGDPIEITLRGYSLTLRKEEAEAMEIDLVTKI